MAQLEHTYEHSVKGPPLEYTFGPTIWRASRLTRADPAWGGPGTRPVRDAGRLRTAARTGRSGHGNGRPGGRPGCWPPGGLPAAVRRPARLRGRPGSSTPRLGVLAAPADNGRPDSGRAVGASWLSAQHRVWYGPAGLFQALECTGPGRFHLLRSKLIRLGLNGHRCWPRRFPDDRAGFWLPRDAKPCAIMNVPSRQPQRQAIKAQESAGSCPAATARGPTPSPTTA
jgi:hypothetical protein